MSSAIGKRNSRASGRCGWVPTSDIYRRKDVETILEIKKLLYEEGFTIAGAKKKIVQVHKLEKESPVTKEEPPVPSSEPLKNLLQEVRNELTEIRQVLSR